MKTTTTTTWTIIWDEIGGRGSLIALDSTGSEQLLVEHSEPISASSDSLAIADLVDFPGAIVSVDHDGEYIHVTFAS